MKTKSLLTVGLLLLSFITFGQGFMPGFDIYSHKQPSYLTLQDGTEVEGTIDKVSRKRNNISGLRMEVNGEIVEYDPAEVKEMYLPANKLNTLSLKLDNSLNTSMDYDLDMINEGYGFFENTEVMWGKKVQTLMMQLVNPSAANKIKVYFDPMAMETMKMSVSVLSTGGIDRSYYIKTDDGPAYKISKANIKNEFKTLFADCPSLLKEIGKKPNWKEFGDYIHAHSSCK
ncbi:MAG: hypothetical protein ACI9IP_003254 [Arcticibacterium sp.]|jgi:hypothetical protein